MAHLVNVAPARVEKLSAVGWGAFFIWMGIAFLMNVSWGTGILGVGIITLAGQAARKHLGLPVDWFWLMTGAIFVVWGVSELSSVQFEGRLLPILSVVAGVAILITGLRSKPRH